MSSRETGMMQRLRNSWARAGSPAAVLVGYSGGADSLGLLGMLRDLARVKGILLTAVHVDHGIRPESAAEAELVGENARLLGVPIVVERLPEGSLARHRGVGLEEALRRERYRVLAGVAGELRAVVAVAHHQRDQAETVLMHLMRGSGLAGVAGMREVSSLSVPWWEDGPRQAVSVWRPLLSEPVDAVRAAAEATGLPVVVDPSNHDIALRRNAIRHRVLPELETVMPGVEATLARFAALAAVDAGELDWQAGEALIEARQGADLSRRRVMELRPAIRSRVVRRWLADGLPVGIEVSRERIEALLAVVETPGPQRLVEIAGGWSVEVTREWLRLVHGGVS